MNRMFVVMAVLTGMAVLLAYWLCLNFAKRKFEVAGIAVLTVMALFLAYFASFALWMTAYHQHGPELNAWQARFYVLLASLFVVCATDLYLVIKVIRSRKDHNVTG